MAYIVMLYIVMAQVGYLLSPFDLLPEGALGVFGLFDDVIIILGMWLLLGAF